MITVQTDINSYYDREVVERIYNNYEIYHSEALENAIEDIHRITCEASALISIHFANTAPYSQK